MDRIDGHGGAVLATGEGRDLRLLCVRRVGMRPRAHREGGGDAWLREGRGEGEGAGGAKGAEGEAIGVDQKPAAPAGHDHAGRCHATGHAEIGINLFLSS